jgi:DNA replication protein DnaC
LTDLAASLSTEFSKADHDRVSHLIGLRDRCARRACSSNPSCALGHKACRDNRSVLYHRVPRLFDALLLARGDGRYGRLLKMLARVELLIVDDWGLAPLTLDQGRDLLEVLDDRHGRSSTIVTSQLPVDHWHELIGNPTVADSVLDRLIHNAHRLILKGDSMRKLAAKQSGLDANPGA